MAKDQSLSPEQMLEKLNAAQAVADKKQAATLPPANESAAELVARLEAAEKALQAAQAENEKLRELAAASEESSNRRSVRPAEQAFVGDGYMFEVSVRSIEKAKLLGDKASRKVRCCDESEALRWFCAVTADPKTGKQLDPVIYPLEAKCLEPERRQKQQMLARQKSVVRQKLEKGMQLSDDEESLFNEMVAQTNL